MKGGDPFVPTAAIREAVKGHEGQILDALGIKLTGKTHDHCPYPGHPDKNPSFRWDEAQAKAFCTCGTQDVFGVLMKMENIDFDAAKVRVAELIKRSDLIRQKKAKRTVIATFDYTDEADEVLFQVRRFEPKAFSQRRPDDKGGRIEGKGAMRGVRIVPYRLPELIAAVAQGKTIYVVEGEKHGTHPARAAG